VGQFLGIGAAILPPPDLAPSYAGGLGGRPLCIFPTLTVRYRSFLVKKVRERCFLPLMICSKLLIYKGVTGVTGCNQPWLHFLVSQGTDYI